MKLTNGLLGLGALLIAGQVSAATVSVTPSVTNVAVDDPFVLTVQGSDFLDGMSDGGMQLTYDTASVRLDSTVGDIGLTLFTNGFSDFFGYTSIDSVNGIITVGLNTPFGSAVGVGGTTFDMFSLTFTAISPLGTSSVNIGLGTIGPWGGLAGPIPEADMVYNGATINVNAVADGDLNADGLVDVVDVFLAQQILTNQLVPTQDQLDHGDVAPLVNGTPVPDGLFNLGDVLVTQRKALGLVNF